VNEPLKLEIDDLQELIKILRENSNSRKKKEILKPTTNLKKYQ
jgi:hypothetical protein